MAKSLVQYGLPRTRSGQPARRMMFNHATGMMEYQYSATVWYGGKCVKKWITYARVHHAAWMPEDVMWHYRRLNDPVAF